MLTFDIVIAIFDDIVNHNTFIGIICETLLSVENAFQCLVKSLLPVWFLCHRNITEDQR